MSFGKAKTRIKEGVRELQSVEGVKHVATHIGIGVAIGAIVELILQYIFVNWVHPTFKDPTTGIEPRIEGFSIFPNQFYTKADGTIVYYTHYYDLILILATVAMLFTKKFWIVIGFLMGWYFSKYMGLYATLGLPTPTTP